MRVLYVGKGLQCKSCVVGESYFVATSVAACAEWARAPCVVRVLCDQWPDASTVWKAVREHVDGNIKVVCSTTNAERRRRQRAVLQCADADALQLRFDEQSLYWRNEWNSEQHWRRRLQEFVDGAESHILALHGPPGCGKSFALRTIARTGQAVALVSCGDFESDSFDVLRHWLQRQWFVLGRHSGALVALDDVELLNSANANALCALLLRVRVRAVVVLDDWYALRNGCWRRATASRCEPLSVPPVHDSALRAALVNTFPGADPAVIDSAVMCGNGDARRAFLDARVGGCAANVGAERRREPPHMRVREALAVDARRREQRCGGAWRERCQELLYVNAPRLVRDSERWVRQRGIGHVVDANELSNVVQCDQLGVLDALASAADAQSLAAQFDEARRESGYGGADAYDVDEQIAYQLGVGVPMGTLAPVRECTVRAKVVLQFPLAKLAKIAPTRTWDSDYERAAVLFGAPAVQAALSKKAMTSGDVRSALGRAAKVCGGAETFCRLAERVSGVDRKLCAWHYEKVSGRVGKERGGGARVKVR